MPSSANPNESERPVGFARIMLRPIGTPLPLGFFAFAVGNFLLSAFDFGWIAKTEAVSLSVLLLAFVAPLELFPAALTFFSRDGTAGTMMGIFGGTWVAIALAHIVGMPTAPHSALGFFYFADAAIVLALAAAMLSNRPFFSAILVLYAGRFILSGLHDVLSSNGLGEAAGVVGFVLCGLALYAAVALALEDQWDTAVLPLFRKGNSKRAAQAGFAGQLERVYKEAGVREQL